MNRRIDGFFWFTDWDAKFHVVAFDKTCRERCKEDRRRFGPWVREWVGKTITELRDHARKDGIALPRDTKRLCLQSVISTSA